MAEAKTVALDFFNKGINLRNTADTIAIEEYANCLNLTSFREGALSTRLGMSQLNTATVFISSTDVHTLAKLKGSSASYRYAGNGIQLSRAATPFTAYSAIRPGVVWAPLTAYAVGDLIFPINQNDHCYVVTVAGTSSAIEPSFPTTAQATVTDGSVTWKESNISGNAMLAVDYALGTDTKAWMFFADQYLFLKDYGTGNPVRTGIIAPPVAPTVAIDSVQSKTIETFESAVSWTETDPSAILTLSDEGTIKKVGTNSLKCAFSAAGSAYITKSVTLDLTTFGAVASGDEDFIHIYVYSSAPQMITEMLIQLSIGATTFAERYEKALGPSDLLAGSNFLASTHVAQRPPGFRTHVFNEAGEETFEEDVSYRPATLEDGANIWTEYRIHKSEFFLVSSTDSTNDWSDVQAIQIKFVVTGATNIYWDDWTLLGGGELDGFDYLWYQVYRSSTTNQQSDPSSASTALTALNGPRRQRATITVRYSKNPYVDFIDVYRSGGTATSPLLSGSVANNSAATGASTTTYAENVADINLGDEMETDNEAPVLVQGVELHNETLWGWGYTSDPFNKVRFSKRVDVDSWPEDYYIFVGSGGDKVVRVMHHDVNLYIFTLADVYQVIGSDNTSYQPIGTGYSRGIIDNKFAALSTPGRIFHVWYDGIYEFPSGRKVSQPIDGVFHGLTINGISPLNSSSLGTLRMAFYDNKLHVYYASGSATSNNAEMVYDTLYERWSPSDQYARAALYETDASILVISRTDGQIFQAETGNTDDGEDIDFDLRTKYLDMGVPDHDKRWTDIMLDIDTAGEEVTAQLLLNNGDIEDTEQTLSTASRSQIQLTVADGDALVGLNAQLKLTGSAGAQINIYKAALRFILEPPRRRSFVTDWEDSGVPTRKIYRTVMIELDTLDGDGVIVELQVDDETVQTFDAIQTNGRQVVYLGVDEDILGTLARLKFTQVTDSTTAVFKLYRHNIDVLPQPYNPETWQTEWNNKNYPYDKYWKELLLELDTFGENRTVSLQIDGAETQTFQVNTTGRQRVTLSVNRDTIGKLARIVITGGETALYSHDYVVDNEPADVTIADSLEQSFGIYRWKQLKRVWLTMKSASTVTMKIYCDEILRSTTSIAATDIDSGWVKVELPLGANIKGKLIRFVLTSSTAFKIYWEQSEVEAKPVGTSRGYTQYRFTPPQMM